MVTGLCSTFYDVWTINEHLRLVVFYRDNEPFSLKKLEVAPNTLAIFWADCWYWYFIANSHRSSCVASGGMNFRFRCGFIRGGVTGFPTYHFSVNRLHPYRHLSSCDLELWHYDLDRQTWLDVKWHHWRAKRRDHCIQMLSSKRQWYFTELPVELKLKRKLLLQPKLLNFCATEAPLFYVIFSIFLVPSW